MPGSRFHIILACALLLGVTAGCNDDITVTQPGVVVHGTVAARVRGFPGNKPLPNATFSMVGTTLSGSADADGVIHLSDLGQGNYSLRVSAPGYASTIYAFEVDGSGAADVHIQNDVPLTENSASLDLTLYSGIDGAPAAGTRASLRFISFPSDYQWPGGSPATFTVDDPNLPTSLVMDGAGHAFLANMPVSTIMVSVSQDSNGDGIVDAYLSEYVTLGPSTTTHATLATRPDSYSARLLSTNLPGYYFPAPFSDSLAYFIFSGAMDTSLVNTYVEVTASDQTEVPVVRRWVNAVRLEVGLPASTLVPHTMYTLDLNVRAANGSQVPFFGGFQFEWEPREL